MSGFSVEPLAHRSLAPTYSQLSPLLQSADTLTHPACIRLDMDDLQCFEKVCYQFEQWGVVFDNAIALQPSNPAFPIRSGHIVLTGAPQSGWIGAQFRYPVSYVGAFVTSSRQISLSAYNAKDELVAKAEIPGSNLRDDTSIFESNLLLSARGYQIVRVVLQAFDGQLTLDEFVYSAA
jgi:hypothetical protein